jgi:hypothetical protein
LGGTRLTAARLFSLPRTVADRKAPRALSLLTNSNRGDVMSGKSVLENVRRYRAIASLCRQTAAFRPDQKWSLLAQAFEYERLARTKLEDQFTIRDGDSRWEMTAAA